MTGTIRVARLAVMCFALIFLKFPALGQTTSNDKQISHYNQTWTSINSTSRFTKHWGMMADFHVRTDGFFEDEYFYFVRLGAMAWINGKYPVALGVAHLWLAPSEGNNTWSDENRIYQQWSSSHKEGIVSVIQRIRTEQRWQDIIVDDEKMNEKKFSFRLRYLAGFEVKMFHNDKLPSLIISDEILVQFGEDVGLNTFDQNRFFIGLKIPIKSDVCFDIGYMNILQQKSSGYQYDDSDIFRLFFYYTPDFRKTGRDASTPIDGNE